MNSPLSTAQLTGWIDDYEFADLVDVASTFGIDQFGYLITPNVELIRYHDDDAFREMYQRAAFVALDSSFLARLLHFTRDIRLPVCQGSDSTAAAMSHADSCE